MPRLDPNFPQLLAIAKALGELREQVVFVGGSTAGLLLTDPLAEGIRPTLDVDAIVQADSLTHFYRIEAGLEERGFVRDAESGVICRWHHPPSRGVFDLMPVDEGVLGFSNRWYEEALRSAQPMRISDEIEIRVVGAPAFIATKLEAFHQRGNGDFLSSHDLEDVLTVVDGRSELGEELIQAPADLRNAVATTFAHLLQHPDFLNCLPGLIAEPERAEIVRERLRDLAAHAT
jgi:hypothetical protein